MTSTKKIDLLDLAIVFAKRKKQFLTILIVSIIVGFIVAFSWPKSYESSITFIVTDGSAINFSSGGLLSGLANLSVSGSKVSSDQALVLIRSKAIQDQVIKEFNLSEVYGSSIPEALRKTLDQSITIDDVREGGLGFNNIVAISATYTEKNPQRAFELINFYYNLLDSTVLEINKSSVEDGFLLIKNRLDKNEKELKAAEDSLVEFQTKHGIIVLEDQAKAQISTIAELKTEIVKLEIQIGFLKETLGIENSQINTLEIQKSQFEKKYDELLSNGKTVQDGFDIFQSISEMPLLYLEYLRRYREVVVQEEIYKVLYPQYEQQKLNYEEANSGLRVIDPAILPTYKSAPKRAYIIIAAFLFGGFFSILFVFASEWKEDMKINKPKEYKRVKEFIYELKRFK